jgi:hypothetical protein
VIGQALYFGDDMEHSLLSPNQIRAFSHKLCLNPKQYTNGDSLHGIHSDGEKFTIPFAMHGCISYVPIRRPTPEEIEECRYICLTAEEEWRPYHDSFEKAEHVFRNKRQAFATLSHDHRSSILPEELARRWGTSLEVASKTLKVTTQRGI